MASFNFLFLFLLSRGWASPIFNKSTSPLHLSHPNPTILPFSAAAASLQGGGYSNKAKSDAKHNSPLPTPWMTPAAELQQEKCANKFFIFNLFKQLENNAGI